MSLARASRGDTGTGTGAEQMHLLQVSRTVLETLALVQAVDGIGMVMHPLEPVLLSLQLPIAQTHPPHDDTSPSQRPELQIVTAVALEMANTADTPGPAYVGPAHRPPPPPIEEGPSIFQYPPSSSRTGLETATGELGASIWSDAPV